MADEHLEAHSFTKAVIQVVQAIPSGQTRTYKEVALATGRPHAYRAVGTILHRVWQTDRGIKIPCHRVIRSDGTSGGYAGGEETKRRLLDDEHHREYNRETRRNDQVQR